jgi:plasmid replication initiation protein
MSDLQVYKSNDLMMAGYKLSVAENRVILTCIAKINRNPEAQVTDQIMYNVTAREFAELCGITMKVAYAELKQAVDSLFKREISFSNAVRKRKTRWVQTADYLKNEGRIELRFATDILPYLVAIQSSYTKYNLRAVVRLSTFNSARLYELIVKSRFMCKGTVLLTLDDIRFAMDIPDDQYPAYADFRKRVIEQAIKEVNRASDINVISFRPKRDGKRIVAIELRYEEKPNFGLDQVQEDLLLEPSAPEQKPKPKAPAKPRAAGKRTPAISEAEIVAHAKPGESREQVIARIKANWKVIEAEVA